MVPTTITLDPLTVHLDQEFSVTCELEVIAELDETRWSVVKATLDKFTVWLEDKQGDSSDWLFIDRTRWLTKYLREHLAAMVEFQETCWKQATAEEEANAMPEVM